MRPPGVSASPRKTSVTTLISLESPNNSSISWVALAMGCPGGRNATLAPFRRLGAQVKPPAASHNGSDEENEERDVRPDRDQLTQPVECSGHYDRRDLKDAIVCASASRTEPSVVILSLISVVLSLSLSPERGTPKELGRLAGLRCQCYRACTPISIRTTLN